MSSSFLDSLHVFYSRLFPFDAMQRWLAYGTSTSSQPQQQQQQQDGGGGAMDRFFHREFSFTLENDIYIRYLSFRNALEFKTMVLEKKPHKIDIGAIYTCPAKDHNAISSQAFRPVQRELVFDIDFTDYSEIVLENSKEEGIWGNNAWAYMQCAMQVLDTTLREDFGFEHILLVFSGRRGIHCWVCDEKALNLEDHERAAVCEYLTLHVKNARLVWLTSPLFPAIKRSLELCTPCFENVAVKFCFANEHEWNKVLEFLPPKQSDVQQRLREEWRTNGASTTPEKKWAQLKATVGDVAEKSNKQVMESLHRALDTIVLYYTYPRLDVNVSTHRNHLLKSPFVIHPKTGNVCVPIFDINKFHPDRVPNLTAMLKELDETGECASMASVLREFETKFLAPLEKAWAKEKESRTVKQREAKRMQKDEQDAANGVW